MSQRNESQIRRNYEFVDADNELMITPLDDENDGRIGKEKPTLLSGHVIDSKNILSPVIDTTATIRTSTKAVPTTPLHRSFVPISAASQPTLPNGEIITAKNTLQSFDTIYGRHIGPPVKEPAMKEGKLSPDEAPKLVAKALSATPVAVAVETESNTVPSLNVLDIDQNGNGNNVPPVSWCKRRSNIVLIALVAVLAALGLGLYIEDVSEGPNSSPVNGLAKCSPLYAPAPSSVPVDFKTNPDGTSNDDETTPSRVILDPLTVRLSPRTSILSTTDLRFLQNTMEVLVIEYIGAMKNGGSRKRHLATSQFEYVRFGAAKQVYNDAGTVIVTFALVVAQFSNNPTPEAATVRSWTEQSLAPAKLLPELQSNNTASFATLNNVTVAFVGSCGSLR
jgi:hypothetical protein